MEEIVKVLLSSGGTVTMAVLFIVFLFMDRQDRKHQRE